MKKMVFLAGAGVLAIGLSGCSPKLDQTGLSPEEQVWADYIKQNYSAWQPPVIEPRGVRGSEMAPAAPAPAAPAALDAAAPAVPQGAGEQSFYDSGAASAAPAPVAASPAAPVPADPAAPVAAAAAGEPEIYTVVKGDTLGAIARKYYGRASAWKKIQDANSALLKGKTNIRPGMKLTIPKP